MNAQSRDTEYNGQQARNEDKYHNIKTKLRNKINRHHKKRMTPAKITSTLPITPPMRFAKYLSIHFNELLYIFRAFTISKNTIDTCKCKRN